MMLVIKGVKSVWLMWCRWGLSVYVDTQRRSVCMCGEGQSGNSGYKISISVLTRRSCECGAKNSAAVRWGGVPSDQTGFDYREKTPNKITARPPFAVWARFCLDPHLYFPIAPLLTRKAWETLSACSSVWQHVSLFKHSEELQSRNLRFGQTTISRAWRILDGQRLRHTLQINTEGEPMSKNKNVWKQNKRFTRDLCGPKNVGNNKTRHQNIITVMGTSQIQGQSTQRTQQTSSCAAVH